MYSNIPRLWNVCKQFLYGMIDRAQYGTNYGPLKVANNAIELPNGMFLKYPHLTYSAGEFLYQSSFNKGPIRTHGPRLCENIIQALARIVITNQMLTIKNSLPHLDVVLTVHDEIICEIHNEELDEVTARIRELMEVNSLDIPLKVDVEICKASWALKKDFESKESVAVAQLENSIDWG